MSSGLGLKPPSDAPSLEGLEFDERVEAMAEWFGENFDDPAQETPYESAEGGYQYIWGGPFDAREELESAFPDATEEEIEAAVDEIQSDGLFDWAPAGSRIQPEDDSYVPEFDEPPFDEQLATLGSRLNVVENWLNAVQQTSAGLGHNRPPPEGRLSLSDEDLAELRQSISELRIELAKGDPASEANPSVVSQAASRFQTFFRWLKNALVGGAVMFAAAYVEGAGNEAWQDPAKFQEHVASIVQTLVMWTWRL